MTTTQNAGPLEEDLQEALSYIRPLLKGHSGDLTIAAVDDGVVTVDFHNACHSCPAISVTFAGLVRSRLMQVDGVKDVRSSQVHASRRALDRIAATLGGPAHYRPAQSTSRPSLPLLPKQPSACQPLAIADAGGR
ncbi:NifU family protein [Arthrobacter sp. Rue61a]|uniref:NifU family protein n=1 Tax=Arthrobacter sp. Rue61a TaxID=1118963 RepID=UPI00027DF64B|nr:NifU family protein [Arthrobacter sp. Rue61a]AFR27753.1 putative NifU-like domain protein [Arthrobacter sp. Rue61a]